MEGWVVIFDWLHIVMVYPHTDCHPWPSKSKPDSACHTAEIWTANCWSQVRYLNHYTTEAPYVFASVGMFFSCTASVSLSLCLCMCHMYPVCVCPCVCVCDCVCFCVLPCHVVCISISGTMLRTALWCRICGGLSSVLFLALTVCDASTCRCRLFFNVLQMYWPFTLMILYSYPACYGNLKFAFSNNVMLCLLAVFAMAMLAKSQPPTSCFSFKFLIINKQFTVA